MSYLSAPSELDIVVPFINMSINMLLKISNYLFRYSHHFPKHQPFPNQTVKSVRNSNHTMNIPVFYKLNSQYRTRNKFNKLHYLFVECV